MGYCINTQDIINYGMDGAVFINLLERSFGGEQPNINGLYWSQWSYASLSRFSKFWNIEDIKNIINFLEKKHVIEVIKNGPEDENMMFIRLIQGDNNA